MTNRTEYLNRVELRGRVVLVKILSVGDGRLARFSLATSECHRSHEGELTESVTWHNVVAYESPLSLPLDDIRKGAFVQVEGRIRVTRYTDCSGAERAFHEILAGRVKAIDTPGVPESDIKDESFIETVQRITVEAQPVFRSDYPDLDTREFLALVRSWAEEFEHWWNGPDIPPGTSYGAALVNFVARKKRQWRESHGHEPVNE